MEMKIIARIHTDFDTKFGLPRQAGLAEGLKGRIIFEPEYRDPAALRGLEDFSHIWVLWEFSENIRQDWSPTVRPPRLGGNRRLGVFATRSSFRPNPIAMSALKLEGIESDTPSGPVITVSGVDMMDGTPIYDIKPYISYTDSISDAVCGFAVQAPEKKEVIFPDSFLATIPSDKRAGLIDALAMDPRPSYHADAERVYGFSYAGIEVKFRADGEKVYVIGTEK